MSGTDYERRLVTTGRNERCPCGSGKKYKKCHLAEDEDKRSAALQALEEEAKARTAEQAESDEGEAEKGTAGKGKRVAGRRNKEAGSKGQATGGKPKNMPRRSAV